MHGDDQPLLITPDMLAVPAEEKRDFERGMSYRPRFTLTMILLLTAIFVWQVQSGGLESEAALIASGALTRARVLEGEWWRLFTATFLHGGYDHLIGNCISLYILGMACEHAFGAGGVAAIYVLSGLGGSIVSVLLSRGPSVGASGAIFGLMSAIIVVLTRHSYHFYVRDKRIALVITVWAIYTLVTGFLTPYVDNAAHLGGMLAGMLAAHFTRVRLIEYQPT